ncbi:pentapeptide repeat-containing protein [Streptomyces chartreusis]|uniref:pentapeptide repeat-containing protein n=1 Tax=Streptomyces chartreusis TaxID=1969 RepID=UPI0036D77B95
MSLPTPSPSLEPPDWAHCGYESSANDPVGCRGRALSSGGKCLAHLSSEDRRQYLSEISPGRDIDFRGTHFSGELLEELFLATRAPDGNIRMGEANFIEASFQEDANFAAAHFTGEALFDHAVFQKAAKFHDVIFAQFASFGGAEFRGSAPFGRVEFRSEVWFAGAWFSENIGCGSAKFFGEVWFHDAYIGGNAYFASSNFSDSAFFENVTVVGGAHFSECRFEKAEHFGPIVCGGTVDFSSTSFDSPVIIEVAASGLELQRAKWSSKATLRIRYADLDLSDAFFEYPLSITGRAEPLADSRGNTVNESILVDRKPQPRLLSLSGVDATHLLITNINLSACRFFGAFNLDQIQLEGDGFATSPAGLQRSGFRLAWWTTRRTIAEEHYWRATRKSSSSAGARGWIYPSQESETIGPAALSLLYRQLRKALEDDKNEPDAADFYYGEMEARRHDRGRPKAERFLLALYWAFSGYGLRASRSLMWLMGAVAGTLLSLTLWGIPKESDTSMLTGHVKDDRVTLKVSKSDPVDPDGSLHERITGSRLEKSFRVTANSVVFRSAGEELTTAGTYIEMSSRLIEPIFLGLAILAIRSRVKR